MDSTPKVTVAHVRELLNDHRDDPVLYVNEEGELDVWVEAHVDHHQVVVRQHEAEEVLLPTGAGPLTDDDIDGYLPILQVEVDRIIKES
ncbi:hypothetical protein [Nocardiopsis synnemataformans]|uniref:hypothetical protein n=1 Tax=Nocardiopsis synnemataformans TaxID=61305 RepID=UPI003EB7E6BB